MELINKYEWAFYKSLLVGIIAALIWALFIGSATLDGTITFLEFGINLLIVYGTISAITNLLIIIFKK